MYFNDLPKTGITLVSMIEDPDYITPIQSKVEYFNGTVVIIPIRSEREHKDFIQSVIDWADAQGYVNLTLNSKEEDL